MSAEDMVLAVAGVDRERARAASILRSLHPDRLVEHDANHPDMTTQEAFLLGFKHACLKARVLILVGAEAWEPVVAARTGNHVNGILE